MVRVTTNGSLHTYKSSLMRSTKRQSDAQNTVLTQRQFNSFGEDPAAATQAFRLRSAKATADQELYNNDAVTKKFSTAWDIIDGIIGNVDEGILSKLSLSSIIKGENATNYSALPSLGQTLSSAADSLIQDMNGKYGDNFIFGGAETLEVPFTWNNGKLCYRGQDVDSMTEDVYNSINDTLYVDIGLGFEEDENGNLITSSAFNSALNGLDFLGGYGTDANGLPNNIVSIMKELGEIYQRYDTENMQWGQDGDAERANQLFGKFEEASNAVSRAHVKLDADTTYLYTNEDRLTMTRDNLNEQIVDLEDVDLANAIEDYVWAQMCYNAALKVGTSIIPQSLMDYMN